MATAAAANNTPRAGREKDASNIFCGVLCPCPGVDGRVGSCLLSHCDSGVAQGELQDLNESRNPQTRVPSPHAAVYHVCFDSRMSMRGNAGDLLPRKPL